jgi:hypothetical protein
LTISIELDIFNGLKNNRPCSSVRIEQRFPKPRAAGSSPARGTHKIRIFIVLFNQLTLFDLTENFTLFQIIYIFFQFILLNPNYS